MVNFARPVLVTITTGRVTVLFTRLFPKSKAVALKEAVVTGWVTVSVAAALWLSALDVPVREMLLVPATALADAVNLNCP